MSTIPLDLAKLPKSKHIKSINFKRTTPGSAAPIIFPGSKPSSRATTPTTSSPFSAPWTPKNAQRRSLLNVLDPSHPLAHTHPASYFRSFPSFTSPHLTVRAVPKALLVKPDVVWPDPPFGFKPYPARSAEDEGWDGGEDEYGAQVGADVDANADAGEANNATWTRTRTWTAPMPRVDMSLMHVIVTKMHKSGLVRSKVKSRIKNAVALVVTKGADVEGGDLVAKEEDAEDPEKWVLPNWTYTIHPTLPIYRMPYTDLIPLLRTALLRVNAAALVLERRWRAQGWEAHAVEVVQEDVYDADADARDGRYWRDASGGTDMATAGTKSRGRGRGRRGDDSVVPDLDMDMDSMDMDMDPAELNPLEYLLRIKTLKGLDRGRSEDEDIDDDVDVDVDLDVDVESIPRISPKPEPRRRPKVPISPSATHLGSTSTSTSYSSSSTSTSTTTSPPPSPSPDHADTARGRLFRKTYPIILPQPDPKQVPKPNPTRKGSKARPR